MPRGPLRPGQDGRTTLYINDPGVACDPGGNETHAHTTACPEHGMQNCTLYAITEQNVMFGNFGNSTIQN